MSHRTYDVRFFIIEQPRTKLKLGALLLLPSQPILTSVRQIATRFAAITVKCALG